MNKFNLERALAGEKVITRDGREVSQFTNVRKVKKDSRCIVGVVGGVMQVWFRNGMLNSCESKCKFDLFMTPKKLSGFINLYHDRESTFHTARFNGNGCHTIIDLSQFDEGHGL